MKSNYFSLKKRMLNLNCGQNGIQHFVGKTIKSTYIDFTPIQFWLIKYRWNGKKFTHFGASTKTVLCSDSFDTCMWVFDSCKLPGIDDWKQEFHVAKKSDREIEFSIANMGIQNEKRDIMKNWQQFMEFPGSFKVENRKMNEADSGVSNR